MIDANEFVLQEAQWALQSVWAVWIREKFKRLWGTEP